MPALLKFLDWLAYSSASLNFMAESNWKQIVYSCSDCSRKEIRTLHIITTKCINYSFNNVLNLAIKYACNILHFADLFFEYFFPLYNMQLLCFFLYSKFLFHTKNKHKPKICHRCIFINMQLEQQGKRQHALHSMLGRFFQVMGSK